jgi:hypothetical protein
MREYRSTYEILVRKPEGMRPVGRRRNIWEINISQRNRMGGCGLD